MSTPGPSTLMGRNSRGSGKRCRWSPIKLVITAYDTGNCSIFLREAGNGGVFPVQTEPEWNCWPVLNKGRDRYVNRRDDKWWCVKRATQNLVPPAVPLTRFPSASSLSLSLSLSLPEMSSTASRTVRLNHSVFTGPYGELLRLVLFSRRLQLEYVIYDTFRPMMPNVNGLQCLACIRSAY